MGIVLGSFSYTGLPLTSCLGLRLGLGLGLGLGSGLGSRVRVRVRARARARARVRVNLCGEHVELAHLVLVQAVGRDPEHLDAARADGGAPG